MAAIQLYFTLRTASMAKTVNLLGSWDNYSGNLPLLRDRASSRSGNWVGTFKFKGTTLQPGKRYWYYYVVDGHHVSYNPQQYSVTEPTTRRILNVLDIPFNGISHNSIASTGSSRSPTLNSGSNNSWHKSSLDKNALLQPRRRLSRENLNLTVDIPKGRPLSVSKIKSPRPITPHATKFILEADYSYSSIQEITSHFSAPMPDKYQSSDLQSPSSSGSSSPSSSFSSRFDSNSPGSTSSTSSFSDYSSSSPVSRCNCERYGTTRWGERIKLECGDPQCGYIDDLNSCWSSDEDRTLETPGDISNRYVSR